MDPQQVVVFQLLETFKASYLSNDFKTCQNVLGRLKEIVDQKASRHRNGTGNEGQKPPLEDFRNMPFDGEWIDQTNWDEYTATVIDKEANKQDEVDGEKEDAKEDEVDEKEDDAKENEEEEGAKEDEVDEKEDEAKEDEEEEGAKEDEVDEKEDEAKEDEEEEEDSDEEEDEEYVVDEEEDDDSGEEEDDDSGEEDDDEIQEPLRRSSRINKVNATK